MVQGVKLVTQSAIQITKCGGRFLKLIEHGGVKRRWETASQVIISLQSCVRGVVCKRARISKPYTCLCTLCRLASFHVLDENLKPWLRRSWYWNWSIWTDLGWFRWTLWVEMELFEEKSNQINWRLKRVFLGNGVILAPVSIWLILSSNIDYDIRIILSQFPGLYTPCLCPAK